MYSKNGNHFVSTQSNIHIHYVKGNKRIIFGLSEKGKPPTLIYPRPRLKEYIQYSSYGDDAMNRVLASVSHDDLHEALFDQEILL